MVMSVIDLLPELLRRAVGEHEERVVSVVLPIPVLVALAVTGRLDRAVEAARAVHDDADRARALGGIGAAVGDRRLVDEALAIARDQPDRSTRASLLGLAGVWLLAFDVDAVVALTHEVPSGKHRDLLPEGIAFHLAPTDRLRAMAVARRITDRRHRESTEARVGWEAPGTVIESHVVEAEDVVKARSLADDDVRSEAFVDLAVWSGRADLADEALVAIGAMDDPEERVSLYVRLARWLHRADAADLAVACACQVYELDWRLEGLLAIRHGLLDRFDDQDLPFGDSPSEMAVPAAQATIAWRLSPADTEMAVAIARKITAPEWRGWALTKLAENTGRVDLARDAFGTTRAPGWESRPDRLLLDIVTLLVGEDPDLALTAARSIWWPRWRVRALAVVGVATDDTVVLEEARAVARRTTHIDDRAHAYVELAYQTKLRSDVVEAISAAMLGSASTVLFLHPLIERVDEPDLLTQTANLWERAGLDHGSFLLLDAVGRLAGIAPRQALLAAVSVSDPTFRAVAVARVGVVTHNDVVIYEALASPASDWDTGGSHLRHLAALELIDHDPQRAAALAAEIGYDHVLRATVLNGGRNAIEAADQITGTEAHDTFIAHVLPAVDPDDAVLLVHQIHNDSLRASRLAQLAARTNNATLADEAITTTRSLPTDRRRSEESNVARSLAVAFPERAIDLALRIEHDSTRAETIAAIGCTWLRASPSPGIAAALLELVERWSPH
jgi:hypothetical protein